MIKRNLIILIIVFYFISFIMSVYGADYYRIDNNNYQIIEKHSLDARVVNNCGYDIFVPVKDGFEWTSFRDFHPSCISFYECTWSGYINIRNSYTCCLGSTKLLDYQTSGDSVNLYCC
ncbi:MAG: hypothetical protein ACLFPJ_04325 [Candidatus Woesearchaeota archaeon]